MGRLRAALSIAVAIASPSFAAQDGPALDPGDPPAVVRTVPDSDARITIPIRIDGKGPWNFIVDTGSQRTVIARDLAERLALPVRERVTVISMTGRAEVNTVAVPRLGFGKSVVDDIEAPVLEGENIGAPGLLGLDGLHAKRLLLNFRTGRMEISNSKQSWRDPNAIIVEARRRRGQLILLDSDVNGSKVNIILDTGTSISVGNMALMNKLVRKKKAPALKLATLTSVTGDTLSGQLGLIDRVRMGQVTLRDIPVMFADARPFAELDLQDKPALLLGIDALKVFDRVAIDFGRGKVDFLLPDMGHLERARFAAARRDAG
ncbi:retroviral-like aspartic protease family protein [Sphingobium sp. JS3065]|uniref:retroviral-like aspartic protease family protein n=1 Tax=Sphingobium sp. JS3065 TaxID=2970925 RepID=UPI00226504A2|nr:retroviral-like aspartic protease family protein [Sphingobium sp. JS3065]UZW54602.1 retroviral-like aspartic protease family protein [Sphingobium sp. JS3065]